MSTRRPMVPDVPMREMTDSERLDLLERDGVRENRFVDDRIDRVGRRIDSQQRIVAVTFVMAYCALLLAVRLLVRAQEGDE